MHRESEQHRFALIEGYRITLSRLEEQFKDRAINLSKKWRQPSPINSRKKLLARRGADRKPSARAVAKACDLPPFSFFRSIGR